MNILVCIKQVPNTEELKVNADAGTSNIDSIPRVVSSFDTYALETAVKIKDEDASTKVCVVTVGPAKAKEALKSCLSVGADKAYHILDDALAEIDSLATSFVLSAAVKEIEKREGAAFDLILLGRSANDTDAGHVGPQLAEHLGYPQLAYAREVSFADGKVRASRETEDGYVVADAAMPAVITVTKTEYEPRYASVKSKMAANRADIPALSAADIGLDAAAVWCPTNTVKTYVPARKTGGVKLEEETGDLAAEKLTALLSDAGVI